MQNGRLLDVVDNENFDPMKCKTQGLSRVSMATLEYCNQCRVRSGVDGVHTLKFLKLPLRAGGGRRQDAASRKLQAAHGHKI